MHWQACVWIPVESESGHIDHRIFAGRVLSEPDGVYIRGTQTAHGRQKLKHSQTYRAERGTRCCRQDLRGRPSSGGVSLSTEARALMPASVLRSCACVSTRTNASRGRGHGRSAGHSRRRRTVRVGMFWRRRSPPRKHRHERRNSRRRARAGGRDVDDDWLPLVGSRRARVYALRAARQAAGRVCATGRARVRRLCRPGRGARGVHRASAAACQLRPAPHAALPPWPSHHRDAAATWSPFYLGVRFPAGCPRAGTPASRFPGGNTSFRAQVPATKKKHS